MDAVNRDNQRLGLGNIHRRRILEASFAVGNGHCIGTGLQGGLVLLGRLETASVGSTPEESIRTSANLTE